MSRLFMGDRQYGKFNLSQSETILQFLHIMRYIQLRRTGAGVCTNFEEFPTGKYLINKC
jgi:hypothetical protein